MFDVIICGARCAGAPLAMLLAREGLRVLLVDRDPLPSESLNGHVIKPAGSAHLASWGLLDRVLDAGTPPLRKRRLVVGSEVLEWVPEDSVQPMVAPRRQLLDGILVDAAAAAGAEVRDRTALTGVVWDGDRVCGVRVVGQRGPETVIRARLVVGADGRHSRVAQAVGAEVYDSAPALTCAYWAYWSDVDPLAVSIRYRPGTMSGVFPTNDGQFLAFAACPARDRGRFRSDPARRYLAALFEFEELREALAGATRQSRVLGMLDLPNFFRRSHGPGWALAGDAGHHKDPLVARGISDAFRDAASLAQRIPRALDAGPQALDRTLGGYALDRDAACSDVYRANLALAADDHGNDLRTLALVRRLAAAEEAADLRFAPTATLPEGLHQRVMAHAGPPLDRRRSA